MSPFSTEVVVIQRKIFNIFIINFAYGCSKMSYHFPVFLPTCLPNCLPGCLPSCLSGYPISVGNQLSLNKMCISSIIVSN